MRIREIAGDVKLLEIAREAIEETLLGLRDARISTGRNNGLVCREKDGTHSNVIRMGPEQAMKIGLEAIADALEERK